MHIEIGDPNSNAVFSHPYDWCFNAQVSAQIVEAVNDVILGIAGLRDDRALAVMGGMLVEHEVDEFLGAIMPGYKKIRDNRDFTFSLKISLARALELCPSRIFGAADTIRLIRNDFSHKLEVRQFDQVEETHLLSLRGHLTQFKVPVGNNREAFASLVEHVSIGLRAYTQHVALLVRFIRSSDALSQLEAIANQCSQH